MEKKWDWIDNKTDKSLAITTVLFYISEQSIISGSRSKQTGALMVRKNPLTTVGNQIINNMGINFCFSSLLIQQYRSSKELGKGEANSQNLIFETTT